MFVKRYDAAVIMTMAACLGFCAAVGCACAADSGRGARAKRLVPVQYSVPQTPESPVSPTNPGTLPGTASGPDTATATNPLTGAPCLGGGASAINGGVPGAPNIGGQAAPGGNAPGMPANNSVYGLNNQFETSPGAC